MDIRDLELFRAVAQTQHFTRAAERCHISQSALTRRIAKLEEHAGVRLFERSTRRVSLTPEGELFAAQLADLHREFARVFSGLRDLAEQRTGLVAVAALPSIAAGWIPQIFARFRQQYPGVVLRLHDALADRALSLLREGKVDLAIVAGGKLAEFETTVLRTERYHLVCPSNHRLSRRKRITLADLKDESLINLSPHSSVRQHLAVAPSAYDRPGGELEVEYLSTVAGLVAAGLGVSLVPELTLVHFRQDGLGTVLVEDPTLRRQVVLAKRKGRALSVAAGTMFRQIVGFAESAR